MRVILYMAITPNGLIDKKDGSADFLTKKESDSYVRAVKMAGALVIGRKTYEMLSKKAEFKKFVKAKIKIVVVSRKKLYFSNSNHCVAHSPIGALMELKGLKQVIVAGGGILNASFLSKNLIDEIYLDVEPNLFSKGINLFEGGDFDLKLKLLGTKMLSENEIQLHYKILK